MNARPSRRRRRDWVGGVALAAALALAACSSGGGEATVVSSTPQDGTADDTPSTTDGGATTSEDEGTTTTTTDGGGGSEEDMALAEAVALDASDFTGDWVASSSDPDDEDLFDCLSEVDREADFLAEFDSDSYTLEVGPDAQVVVSSTGVVLADEAVAEGLLDEVAGSAFAGCARDQYVASFDEAGVESRDVTLDPAPGVEPIRDQTSVLNGSFTLAEGATTTDGGVSIWLVRTGSVVSGFAVTEIGAAGLAATVDEVASLISDKHEAEVG